MKKLIFRKINKDTLSFFLLMSLTFGLIVWTLQAVNYLDYVTQDGHGLKTYFMYTLHNFPKIIHRIIPFVFFISLFFIFTNYELKNELSIFWTHGVSKLKFINNFVLLSIFLLIFQIIIGSIVSPLFQFKARLFLKNSEINFFSSLIKEGKFINAVEGLTIFINKKNIDNSFSNIFIDDSSKSTTRMIYAKKGIIVDENNKKIFKLYSGEVLNKDKSKVNVFEFEQIDFSLSEYSTSTILVPKVQELSTKKIINCYLSFNNSKINILNIKKESCEINSEKVINQEFIKRLIKPFYIPLITIVCCFLIVFPKNDTRYFKNRRIIFLLAFLVLLISETTLRYLSSSNFTVYLYFIFPCIFFLFAYMFLFKKIKNV